MSLFTDDTDSTERREHEAQERILDEKDARKDWKRSDPLYRVAQLAVKVRMEEQ